MNFSKRNLLLYAVTDRTWLHGNTLAEQVQAAIDGGISCLQLREKESSLSDFISVAQEIRVIAQKSHIPFIINDNLDVALRCHADGAHIGQTDLPVSEARKMLGPDRILGVSAQTVAQALQAQRDGADYLGVGAVFGTTTKEDADCVSLQTLREICAAVTIPVVAIGGISLANLSQLKGLGLAGVAVISALFSTPNITANAAQLRKQTERMIHYEMAGSNF